MDFTLSLNVPGTQPKMCQIGGHFARILATFGVGACSFSILVGILVGCRRWLVDLLLISSHQSYLLSSPPKDAQYPESLILILLITNDTSNYIGESLISLNPYELESKLPKGGSYTTDYMGEYYRGC